MAASVPVQKVELQLTSQSSSQYTEFAAEDGMLLTAEPVTPDVDYVTRSSSGKTIQNTVKDKNIRITSVTFSVIEDATSKAPIENIRAALQEGKSVAGKFTVANGKVYSGKFVYNTSVPTFETGIGAVRHTFDLKSDGEVTYA